MVFNVFAIVVEFALAGYLFVRNRQTRRKNMLARLKRG
jgi:hypothetical protein